jgi:hypothetical protein
LIRWKPMVFDLTLKITARDAVDGSIAFGRAGLNVVQQVSTTPVKINEMILSALFGQPLTIPNLLMLRLYVTISATDYTPERAIISYDNSAGVWQSTNPHVVPTGSMTSVDVAARLGVLRFAPQRFVAENTDVPGDHNPGAALIEARGNAYAYRGLWLEETNVARLSDPIAGKPSAPDWERFSHEKKRLKAKEFGTFALLEFGFPPPYAAGRSRFLVGVWYPNQPLGDMADVHCFFSPNTGDPYPGDAYPFAKGYPYRMNPNDGKKGPKYTLADLHQPYPGLTVNYVCIGYKIVYQMLAAGKNSMIVMPVQPAAQWGPLQTRTCLWRLVVEAVRFGESQRLIARTGKTGPLNLAREGAGVDTELVGPPSAPFARNQIVLTTSAFSAGLGAMLGLITTEKLKDDKNYPASHFWASDAECQAAWKRIWDVDGAFHQLGGLDSCVRSMLGWRKGGLGRQLRMYHTEDTVSASNTISTAAPEIAVKRANLKMSFVDQGYSSDRSLLWVLFGNPTLTQKSPPDDAASVWPSFGSQDAHHMAPTVSFGHAYLIS